MPPLAIACYVTAQIHPQQFAYLSRRKRRRRTTALCEICRAELHTHRRCAGCTVLVGPDHLETELLAGVCADCRLHDDLMVAAAEPWTAPTLPEADDGPSRAPARFLAAVG